MTTPPPVRVIGTYACAKAVTFEPTDAELEMLHRETLAEWLHQVVAVGGWPCGVEPTVERVANPTHGMIMTDGNGDDMLGEDGEPLRDPVLFTLIARGRALKPAGDSS